MTRLLMLLSKLLQKHRKMKKWKRIVTTLAAVVTFVTTYALILPAITVEKNRADEVAGLYLEEGTAGEAAAIHSDEGNVDRAGDMYPEQEAAAEIMTLKATGSDYTVILSYDETSKVPEGATLAVSEIAQDSEEYKTYLEETKKAMGYAEEDTLPRYAARFFDIKIMDGNQEFTPESGVSVEIAYDEPLAQQSDAEVRAVHFADDAASAEVIEANAVEPQNEETSAVEFTAESFSVYGVIYTVDFEYSVDGETYEFSLPGGGFVSFSDLIEVLGITNVEEDAAVVEDETEEVPAADGMPGAAVAEDETEEVPAADGMPDAAASDAAKQFTENIESVEFSDPRLIWVGKVDADTTVGALKEENALECEYSAELTEEEIAEINARKVESKDWALISVRPFTSEESLTVTMKDGEAFTVKVTDYQISTNVLAADGKEYKVTVTYGPEAKIPDGSTLRVEPFEEGSEEYEYARNAVLADKLEKGEYVRIDDFNLAALDISIIASDGSEIEPCAAVQVDLKINELPGVENLGKIKKSLEILHHVETEDGVVVEKVFDGSDEGSFRMETNKKVVEEGTVIDPDSVDLKDFENMELAGENLDVSFETEKFSTFTIRWYSSWRSTTVHYGYMSNGTFTEFDAQPSPVDIVNGSGRRAYLIYDFDGYQYSGQTYYRTSASSTPASGGTRIQALLQYNYGWQYRKYSTNTDGGWSDVAYSGSHIYVVYEPEPSVPQGGTPVPKQTDDEEYPEEPDITKESTDNYDGTRTISLSVAGHTKELEVEKLADVIVVFDTSGSMRQNMAGNDTYYDSRRRLTIAKNAVNAMARTLLAKTNSSGDKLIRMSLISFNDYATVEQEFTDNYSTFSGAVNDLSAANGTNWEHALKLANQMAVESDRATFVIFVSDGDPTSRVTRMNATDEELDLYKKGTDPDYLSIYHIFGNGATDPYGYDYDAALSEAQSIVKHKKIFYTIAISNNVSNMEKLSEEAGGSGNYTATTSTELEDAFNDIASSITARMGHSDVKITDGITDLTQTVQKSSLVNFEEDDLTYYKERTATQEEISDRTKVPADAELVNREGTYYVVWDNWDPTSEHCALAYYDSDEKSSTYGSVIWNMGENFMLEDGYTYKVRFKVWPSQEAYDLLADLNNGVKYYDYDAYVSAVGEENALSKEEALAKQQILSKEESDQIAEPKKPGGMYTLKTNSDTGYTYRKATKSGDTVTPTGNPSEPKELPEVDPLELTTRPLKVKKQWHNNYVDSRTLTDHITMELYGVDPDGTKSHDFKTITLRKDEGWYAENNFISYGLVTYDTSTNADEKIYETGHDFTLRETDDEAHYYELTAGTYRPMFINGKATILEQVDAAPPGMSGSVFHYYDGTNHYYRLDERIYRDTESDILMIATNSHRSYMDLTKVVVDEAGEPAIDDSEFEYEVCFEIPISEEDDNYESEQYIWFNVYDTVSRRVISPDEFTYTNAQKPGDVDSSYSGDEYAGYLVALSGDTFTIKIRQGWNVRFLNLMNGTTYSFEEINIPEGRSFVKAEVGGTRWIANMVDGEDQGHTETMTGLPSNTNTGSSNTEIGGTIEYANARYKTTYTNQAITRKVSIFKTAQDGSKPLPGAKFSLYTESGYNADPKIPVKKDLTSGKDGVIDLGSLSFGTYYLMETAAPAGYVQLSEPVLITVTDSGVTYNQDDNALSSSNQGVHFDTETQIYTLVVTNDAGFELPSTGGRGTMQFYILGVLFIGIAGVGVLLRRRFPILR